MCFYVFHRGIERMKTLEELKAAIQTNMLELEKLEQNPWLQTKYALGEKAVLREKDIGQLCYEAEETLSVSDLIRLKQTLGIDKHQWRLYKSRFVRYPPEKD